MADVLPCEGAGRAGQVGPAASPAPAPDEAAGLVDAIVEAVREADDVRIRGLLQWLVPLADTEVLLLLRAKLLGEEVSGFPGEGRGQGARYDALYGPRCIDVGSFLPFRPCLECGSARV